MRRDTGAALIEAEHHEGVIFAVAVIWERLELPWVADEAGNATHA